MAVNKRTLGCRYVGEGSDYRLTTHADRALTMELCRIVSDRKLDLQDPSIADQLGVEDDPDRFRRSCCRRADHSVMRAGGRAERR
jgi:hypothetical protein